MLRRNMVMRAAGVVVLAVGGMGYGAVGGGVGPSTRPLVVEGSSAGMDSFGQGRWVVGNVALRVRFAEEGEAAGMTPEAVAGWVGRLRWRTGADSPIVLYPGGGTSYTALGQEGILSMQILASQEGGVNLQQATEVLVAGLREMVARAHAGGGEAAKAAAEAQAAEERLASAERAAAEMPAQDAKVAEAYQAQRLRLAMESIAKEARAEAVRHAIDQLRGVTQESMDADEVMKQYRKLVELSEQQLARASELGKQGMAPAAEVQAAQAKVAEARAQVAMRAAALSKSGKGETLDKLTDELTFNAVDLETVRRQMAQVQQELDQAREGMRTIEHMNREIGRLREEAYRAMRQKLLMGIEAIDPMEGGNAGDPNAAGGAGGFGGMPPGGVPGAGGWRGPGGR